MNPVVHFEMPYEDKQRMADFYSKTFGWKMQMMGPEMGDYVVAQTSKTDEKGMIAETGRINGGFFKRSPENPNPSLVISVPDIKAAMEKVKAAGGQVSFTENGEPMNIPGIGLYVGITDTEGNRVSMLQPSASM